MVNKHNFFNLKYTNLKNKENETKITSSYQKEFKKIA